MKGIIYKYTNLLNGKIYIGRTINEQNRKATHLYASLRKRDLSHFHNAIRKYGIENFKYDIIYTVNSNIPNYVNQILNLMEPYYINLYNSRNRNIGYNITKGGEDGSHPMTDELKIKISLSKRGHKMGEEARRNISNGHKGIIFSEERKRNISNSKKGIATAPQYLLFKYNNNDELIGIFRSIRELSNESSINYDTLRKTYNKKNLSHNFYFIKSNILLAPSDNIPKGILGLVVK